MCAKTRVYLLFGGRSGEHEVSLMSARNVLEALDRSKYEVIPVGITKEGRWLQVGDPLRALTEGVAAAGGRPVGLLGDPSYSGPVPLSDGLRPAAHDGPVVFFPVLHGTYGEDGTIQGLLEMAGVPYVGAGVLASAVSMDKEFTKKLLQAEGLEVGRYEILRRDEETLDERQRERLGLPVFVKPARGGSSLGISKVTDWSQLDAAIAEARRTDPKVIVEAAVVGREVECAVLEFPDGRVESSYPSELRVTGKTDWYDYESKYLDDVTEFDVPAKLDDEVTERLRQQAVRAFRAVDCQGLARVDFFLPEDGRPVVNELNTMPGFTSISLYPRMWAHAGLAYPDLLTTLIETALARGTGLR